MKSTNGFLSAANEKYFSNFIYFYFAFSALKGCSGLMGHEIPFTIISDIGIIFITIGCLSQRINALSKFILVAILTITLTSLLNSYPINALISGIRWQLFYMLAFIVGTSKYLATWKFFDVMVWVVFIVDLIGLYLYFTSPGWYMDYKFQNLDLEYITDNMMLEMTRLSSFWPYPYWVSYGSACCYFYILCQYYYGNIKSKNALFFLLFFFFILLLAQQRLPLFFVACATLILLIRSMSSHDSNRMQFVSLLLGIIVSLLILLLIVLPIVLDSSILEFGIQKIEAMFDKSESRENDFFLVDRFNFIKNIDFKGASFFGEGLGRYSLNSDASYKILDNMWLTIFVESGIWGLFVYIFIFLCVVKKGCKNLKYNLFELGILGMFLIAMFGANCLSKNTQHAIVLWLCCGRIYSNYCLTFKKNTIHI